MLTHIFALIGLVALCVAWVLFRQWLVRQDPERKEACKPGCGSCGSGGCSSGSCSTTVTVSLSKPSRL